MQLDIQIIILKEMMTVQNRNNSVQLSGQRGKMYLTETTVMTWLMLILIFMILYFFS